MGQINRQLLAVLMAGVALPAVARAELDIPVLNWQPRSDWVNVEKDVVPPAVGDGRADDTTALQAALDRGAGKTIYLPPGTYRITQTLAFHGPGVGSAIIGAGRATRIVWGGPAGGRMFWSDGIAYSRYVGLTWDGQNRAAVGFDHASKKQFETEVEHKDEAFRNFTGYGIRVGNEQKVASAEILYQNCLFENCGTALGFLTFNDYDNTIDGCEFQNCGTGVFAHKSNFYARDCHFENSRGADFRIGAEHGCSIRRCTSEGAKLFVWDDNPVAPLTLQDCQVADWSDPDGAVFLGSPTLMFDCGFSRPPSRRPPVKLLGNRQKLIISNNQVGTADRAGDSSAAVPAAGSRTVPVRRGETPPQPAGGTPGPQTAPADEVAGVDQLVQGAPADQVRVIPPGRLSGVVTSADEHFLQSTEDVSGKVFDAVRDFGARGNGQADDTAAIQSAIDAARRAGPGAVAYLPLGRYRVSRTLTVTGADYTVSGSGFRSGLIWHGQAGEPFMEIAGVTNVTLANLAIGNSDYGPMNHGDDIRVSSPPGAPCRLVLDGVYAFGKYQKAPDKHGIHFVGLPAGSVVDAEMVQGNLRVTDCAQADLLFRTSYEGTVTIEGVAQASTPAGSGGVSPPVPDSRAGTVHEPAAATAALRNRPGGLTGFLTRLTTASRPALRVFDDQSVVMSDFYVEQSDQIAVFTGTAGQPPGAVTIQSPKAQTGTNSPMLDIQDYSGRIYYGQSQFYCQPAETKFQSSGTRPLQVLLAGNFWYNNHPAFELAPATRLTLFGNSGATDTTIQAPDLSALAAALDDLRRLGRADAGSRGEEGESEE